MNIELANIPEEGLSLSGELPASIFDLPDEDALADGPLSYDLHVQQFDDELLLRGFISAPFIFTCVRTLHPFRQTITIPHAALAINTEGKEVVDPTDDLREEILILMPANPKCDDADEPQHCEIDSKYLALDKDPDSGVKTPPAVEGDSRWDALDAISSPENDTN